MFNSTFPREHTGAHILPREWTGIIINDINEGIISIIIPMNYILPV